MTGDIEAGTPAWLRARNERTALERILENGPLTRTELGRLTGLSKPTTAQIIGRLERLGVITAVGTVSAGPGPNAVSYAPHTDGRLACAIDVGESTISAVVVDPAGTEYPVIELPAPDDARSPEGDVRRAVTAAAAAAGVAADAIRAVGVGVQAAVADNGDDLSLTDTLGGWPEAGARTRIAAALGVDAWLENDVNLAAVAERAEGAAAGADDFALIWLGAGVGVALDLGGRIHRGASGMAGELGYLAVPAGAVTVEGRVADVTDLVGTHAVSDLLARIGDDHAVAELASRIAIAISPVLAVVDPALVVLGGPTSATGGERLAAAVEARLAADGRWHPRVAASAVADRPVLAGARRLLLLERRAALLAELAGDPALAVLTS